MFLSEFIDNGFFLDEGVIPVSTIDAAKCALGVAIKKELRLKANRPDGDPLLVACCPYYDNVFLSLLSGSIFSRVDEVLGGSSILYSYNNSSIAPGGVNFAGKPHVERQYHTGSYIESIGVLILLDDFTLENGATWYLPKSHLSLDAPSSNFFNEHAERLIAKAGSVFYFHPCLWHASGINMSGLQRDALSIGFCRPYLKQRLDLVSVLSDRIIELSDKAILQKLGVFSVPPKTLDDFYSKARSWYDS